MNINIVLKNFDKALSNKSKQVVAELDAKLQTIDEMIEQLKKEYLKVEEEREAVIDNMADDGTKDDLSEFLSSVIELELKKKQLIEQLEKYYVNVQTPETTMKEWVEDAIKDVLETEEVSLASAPQEQPETQPVTPPETLPVTLPVTPPETQPETQSETQSEIQSETQSEIQSEIQPKNEPKTKVKTKIETESEKELTKEDFSVQNKEIFPKPENQLDMFETFDNLEKKSKDETPQKSESKDMEETNQPPKATYFGDTIQQQLAHDTSSQKSSSRVDGIDFLDIEQFAELIGASLSEVVDGLNDQIELGVCNFVKNKKQAEDYSDLVYDFYDMDEYWIPVFEWVKENAQYEFRYFRRRLLTKKSPEFKRNTHELSKCLNISDQAIQDTLSNYFDFEAQPNSEELEDWAEKAMLELQDNEGYCWKPLYEIIEKERKEGRKKFFFNAYKLLGFTPVSLDDRAIASK